MARLTIGDVVKRAGLSAKAIRLYEARGLLAAPARTETGYRTYSEHDVALLRFIRQARALDLGLEEIRHILDLQQEAGQPCATVVQFLDAHVREIDQTMAALRELRKTLVAARNSAKTSNERGDQAVVCRLIESGAPSQS